MHRKNSTHNQKSNPLLLLGLTGLVLLLILLAAAGQQRRATAAPTGAQSADGLWQDVEEALLRIAGDRVIVPTAYRTVALDWEQLNVVLANMPASLDAAAVNEVILSLPLPDGSYGRFQIYQTAVMHPDLAAKFPEIRTFAGIGLDDPTAYARLDTTPKGFHAMILSANGRVFIDPYSTGTIDLYQSYYASDFIPNLPEDFAPDVVVEPEDGTPEKPAAVSGVLSSGGTLRTYRLAVAATGEYTEFHGGTVNDAMAEITTAINRVAGIYEREVAVTFQLVPDNDQIIYSDGNNDPYTNSNGSIMLGQNQTTLDAVIGAENYDIGHVFSTGGGGIAGLGVVCNDSAKAQGVTGLSPHSDGSGGPVGDPFYVDYVAHEMGHQFSANHTFNSNTGACNLNNQWNADTAYEPGSGSTIMAYAGICAPQNLQSNSDDYFHAVSFYEIVGFTTAGLGSSCGETDPTGNMFPAVDAGSSYHIPLRTPFTLTGSATDPDESASLTYNWEQFDKDLQGFPEFPSGDAPIFRSFPATTSPSRTFPRISYIVNNSIAYEGEVLPTYGRTMNFRLTVRDNQVPAGGVAYDETTVTAVDDTGPFLVTAPNTAVTWTGNSIETVTWNVANTNLAPISCANVNIQLSTDGGYTFPTILDLNTPNDGSEDIFVPNIVTSSARVRVSCAGNIFFDISNSNFSIEFGEGGDPSLDVDKSVDPAGTVSPGELLTYTIVVTNTGNGPASNTVITDTFAPALTSPECDGVPGNLNRTGVSINPLDSVSYICTAVVDPSLALAVEISAVPTQIKSSEEVTYTITVTNSHSNLSLNNVQVSAPGVTGCTPALSTSQTLAPGASQTYACPNNAVSLPGGRTATATGRLTISNIAYASAPDDPDNSSPQVNSQVLVTGSDSVTITFTDYFYLHLPIISR